MDSQTKSIVLSMLRNILLGHLADGLLALVHAVITS